MIRIEGGRQVVRNQPYRIRPRVHREIVAATLNPVAVNWYAEKAFELEAIPDDMSIQAPWLFGPQGLYPTQWVVPKCEPPCEVSDGVCVCPE